MRVIGADQVQADFAAKLPGPRLLRQERIRARLDDKAVGALGNNLAAQPISAFEQGVIDALLLKFPGSSQPGDPPADYDHTSHRSTRRSMDSGRAVFSWT